MTGKIRTKLVHEGQFIAEVEIQMIESAEGWSPYMSLDDAYRLDDMREALRHGDIRRALQIGRVYTLVPVAG